MVRVPGSSADSGYHRESDQEDVKIKVESGIGASTEGESPSSHVKSEGYTDCQSFGRNSGEGKEAGPAMDLEEKPHPPPLGPSGPPADRDANRDPPDEDPSVKTEGSPPKTTPPTPRISAKKPTSKLVKSKLRAPDEEKSGDLRTWTPDQLQKIFYRKQLNAFLLEDPVMTVMKPKLIGDLQGPVNPLVKASDLMVAITSLMNMLEEAGIVTGAFAADDVFKLSLITVEESSRRLIKLLKPLVGVSSSSPSLVPIEEYPNSASSHSGFASAKASVSVNITSGSPTGSTRMVLDTSGAEMIQARKIEKMPLNPVAAARTTPDIHSACMQSFFNSAMERFLKEQSEEKNHGETKAWDASDVDMESVGSVHTPPDEYELDVPRRTAVTSVEAAAFSEGAAVIPRVRMSAISELNEFSGSDTDEDRTRGWLDKVNSAFVRDQASDSEKCIVFRNLLTGPARIWYWQLGRTTRGKWKNLLDGFEAEYCGLGVSFARQYYNARNRSDESPLEYLHRLTVLGLRAKLPIKTGSPPALREHVEHFIETLHDRDLADQLILLRLRDGDALADVLRIRQRPKARQGIMSMGSSKYRSKTPSATPPPASAEHDRAVRAIRMANASESSESDSDSEELDLDQGRSQAYLAAVADHRKPEDQPHQLGKPKVVNSLTRHPPGIGKELQTGESRGYWKYYSPGKWFKPAKITGKINNSKATMLLDSGAEISIVDTTFARKVGCTIDESQKQECVGIGENAYTTLGRTMIKVTLVGYLVYFFDVWVGLLAGQDAILGMDFMIPAGIRLDLADGTMCLADEVRTQLSGRRPSYGRSKHSLLLEDDLVIPVEGSAEIALKPPRTLEREKLWIVRGEEWVPTLVKGFGRRRHLRITNVGDHELHLGRSMELGMWLAEDLVPRVPGHVSVGSRRYAEWQTLVFETTTDRQDDDLPTGTSELFVERPEYATPTQTLRRGETAPRPTVATASVRSAEPLVNLLGTTEAKLDYTEEKAPDAAEEPQGELKIEDTLDGDPLWNAQDETVRVNTVTRLSTRSPQDYLQESVVQSMRLERIAKAQGKKNWATNLKTYLTGDVNDLSAFFLAHSWGPRSTLEASLPVGNTCSRDRAREVLNERLREAIRDRADRHNEDLRPHNISAGDQVWLYLDRVKVGYARKLAHLWHGPFRVAEMIDQHAAKLEIAGTEYRIFPIVHVSKLKLVKKFPDRPNMEIVIPEEGRVDFDEAFLPEDSWERELDEDEYEVEEIMDVRSSRKIRYGRNRREFLVRWKGYDEPTWVDEEDLNCGALLREFERSQVSRSRFGVMQSHEEEVGGAFSQ